MASELQKITEWGDLHQVWFVRDYYRLTFQDYQQIEVFNDSSLNNKEKEVKHGEDGFSDFLVSCIESCIKEIKYVEHELLELEFSNNSKLKIDLSDEGAHGPEAFEIQGDKELGHWVEFN
jgi:hypothetical protein